MTENAAARTSSSEHPALSPQQLAFLATLLPGPRPAAECQDAITVGSLMRLNLVAWHETQDQRPGYRNVTSTFALTAAGEQLLADVDDPQGDAPQGDDPQGIGRRSSGATAGA